MKLSAPPPPPPEPNAPGDGQQSAAPGPDVAAPVPTDAAPPPAAPKVVAWPAWFAGADFLLAVMVLVLAFMAASFVARNSDVWLHLAAGKRLLAGEYSPGSDPFSFSGADRTWVNHSLLFDVGAYLVYGDSGNGGALVVVKALFAAAAFGLVIAIRRPGFPLWPWAAVAAVGVVAAAPYLLVRPIVGSLFLLAVTLFLLFRVEHRPGSWRFPVAFGVVCWLWANVDEWFFLGPLTVALVLVGELIQRQMGGTQSTTPPNPEQAGTAPHSEEPLGALPDVPTLAKALGVGLLACMLNPHHVGVWQLPFELVGTRDSSPGSRFEQILATPLDRIYTSNEGFGNNHNGLAYAVLFVAGGAALGLAVGRLRIAHVALWVGYALLSLQSMYAISFLALVAVPVIASQLNSQSARATLSTWNDPRTRFLLFGSAGGRVLSLAAVLVACVLAWPGWLHPPMGNPALARRVAWGVEPEPAIVKGVEQLQAWRESGRLPAETRGAVTTLDFANYCAWFAPREKVYVNGRYNHHRPEWADYVKLRAAMRLARSDAQPNPNLLPEVMRKLGAEYVVLQAGLVGDLATEATVRQWSEPDNWSTWYMNGRVTISGWRPAPGAGKPSFDALQIDPVALAFGPGAERLPAGAAQPVLPRGGWEEEFIRSPGLAPPGVDEATIWFLYGGQRERGRYNQETTLRLAALLLHAADRVVGVPGTASRFVPPIARDDRMIAAAFLAFRAARRAIADDPQHPDSYWALFMALQNSGLPISNTDRIIGQITALRQCLERLPPPEHYQPGVYRASPLEAARLLALVYSGPRPQYGNVNAGILVNESGIESLARAGATGVLVVDGNRVVRVPLAALQRIQAQVLDPGPYLFPIDLLHDTLQKALDYARVEALDDTAREQAVTNLKNAQKGIERELAASNNAYEARRVGKKLDEQVRLALESNLAGKALHLLTTEPLDELGQNQLDYLLYRVALELVFGRLEDAADDLKIIGSDTGWGQRMNARQLATFRGLLYQKYVLEGNYADAGRLMEEMNGSVVREDPTLTEREKFDPKPFVKSEQAVPGWNMVRLSALLAPNPWELAGRSLAAQVVLDGYQVQVSPNEVRSFPGFLRLQDGLARFRAVQAEFFFRRGMLFLFEGDMAEAERRFLQTRLEPVESWGLPAYRHPGAEAYLGMIAEARRLAPAK